MKERDLSQFRGGGGDEDDDVKCAFILIGINNLTHIIESLGYPFGDYILGDVAATLMAVAHEKDLSSRIEGGLFAMFVPDVEDKKQALEKIRILHAALSREPEGNESLSISIGASAYPGCGTDYDTLYEQASEALLSARNSSRAFVFRSSTRDNDVLSGHSVPSRPSLLPATTARPVIHTFNFFDVFVDNEPVVFHSEKAKELLALLVDRRGGFVSSVEAITYLWPGEGVYKTTLARYRKYAMRLKNTLEEYGIQDIVEVTKRGLRRIVPERIDCDYYRYLSGAEGFRNIYTGSYLARYGWAEGTRVELARNHEE